MNAQTSFAEPSPCGECPMCGHPAPGRLLVAQIQSATAAYYRIPVSEMFSARRSWEFSHPRQIAMYLSRELTPKSLPDIGRRFGRRDHTTVMHAIKMVKQRIEDDREVALDVDILRERLSLGLAA